MVVVTDTVVVVVTTTVVVIVVVFVTATVVVVITTVIVVVVVVVVVMVVATVVVVTSVVVVVIVATVVVVVAVVNLLQAAKNDRQIQRCSVWLELHMEGLQLCPSHISTILFQQNSRSPASSMSCPFSMLVTSVACVSGEQGGVRRRYGWVKFRECGEFLYGRKFSLKLKGAVY